jgi:recombination protein RecT
VSARVNKRLRVLGIGEFPAYLAYLEADQSGEELVYLLDAISTNVTSFFREADHFEFFMGDEEKIVHRIDIRAPRGKPIAVYAVIQLVTGGVIREVMTVDQINVIRDRSDGWRAFAAGKIKSTPWSTDWDEMARKTVFRRAQKLLPRSPELERFHCAVERVDEDYSLAGEEGPAQAPVKARGAASALLRDVTPAPAQPQPQAQQDDDRGAISRGDDYDRETGEIIDQQPMQQPARQQAQDMDPI